MGKTSGLRPRLVRRADHPHACGENTHILVFSSRIVGPSPRVWGKLYCPRKPLLRQRTIPTRVGKTFMTLRAGKRTTDHPHACGENPSFPFSRAAFDGPSPRVWGKHGVFPEGQSAQRTIPTRVGKTLPDNAPRPRRSDHPHACGENGQLHFAASQFRGPSPRVWGKLPRARESRA